MKKNTIDHPDDDTYGSPPSTLDFRGRQSVRATFRLSEACIDAISILSTQLGIKQKSIFDHLMEDARALKEIALHLDDLQFELHERVQKTFVVSRRSLSFLEAISSKHNAPRDALVEYSVRRLLPLITKEREKHEKRKELFAEISDHFTKGETLLSKAAEQLGPDDPVVNKLKSSVSAYKNALEGITILIERGKIMEEFESQE